jgi:chromosome segregation ATPase
MHKRSDVPRTQPENSEVEYYKTLAQISEDRAREIRRIAALDRAKLEQRLLEQEPTIKAYAEEQGRLRVEKERLKLDQERLRESYDRLKASSQRMKDNSQRLEMELASTRAQLKALQKAQKTLAASRAHRLANTYVRLATGHSLFARTLRIARPVARALHRIRQALR